MVVSSWRAMDGGQALSNLSRRVRVALMILQFSSPLEVLTGPSRARSI